MQVFPLSRNPREKQQQQQAKCICSICFFILFCSFLLIVCSLLFGPLISLICFFIFVHDHFLHSFVIEITLLRVIPTLAFQVIYSDIYFDILPITFYLTSILIFYLAYLSAFYLVYILAFYLAYSGILCGILSRIYFGILCGTLCGIYSGSLSGIYSRSLSGIYSGIPSGRWGPAVPTELGRSQVEVQRCPLGSEGPWLRSSGAHCAQNLAVEVQRCPLRSEAGSWGPAVPTARGSWRRDWRRVGKAEVDVEVEAEVVEKEEDEEEVEEKEAEEPEQLW